MNNLQVSIVIVCMNNLKNLYPCLEGIKKYTTISYETLIVAYLFSKENIEKVKRDFPWATFIESNEIRGFSENNNLALRQARGRYCYILNDDTLMDSPVIDGLVKTMEHQKDDVAVVSPNIKYPDGRAQFCGRNKTGFWTFLKSYLGFKFQDTQYVERKGCFKTFNIMGAAFLIKTDIFKSIGWFDEYYFFCPEDIAVSTKLNEMGYRCIVNGDIVQYHIQGGTWSVMQTATEPVHMKGSVKFYSENSILKKIILTMVLTIRSIMRFLIWSILFLFTQKEKAKIKARVYMNIIHALFSSKSPKELFIKYYKFIYKK